MLKINGLYKNFGALQALDNVDMEVKEGEIHGVIGPNGSGKTTLFNCITGTLKPDGGKVFFKDEEITGLAAHVIANKGIHRTFQAGRLISNLTVLENIMCGVQDSLGKALKDTMVRWPFTPSNREKEIREKAESIAEFIGLADVMNAGQMILSGRTTTCPDSACAHQEPSLLLLDEPASGMGPHEIENMEDIIRKIRGMGITIVVVSHEVKMLMNLSEIVTVLNFGQKIAENVPEIIQKDTRVLEAYLGTE